MNLTQIRNLRGLSQQALADMIGKDKATISRAESLSDGTTMKIYKACAKALGVTLYDLFADSRSAAEAELVRAFRNIPAERHEQLLGLIRLAESQPLASSQSEK